LAGAAKTSAAIQSNDTFNPRVVRFPDHALLFCAVKLFPGGNFRFEFGLFRGRGVPKSMLVERGMLVMNVEVVGDAYAIASNYLRRTGAISDTLVTNDRLFAIIVQMFQRGEFNRIRLANKAIAKFEAAEFV
jgi:hypothetical protein